MKLSEHQINIECAYQSLLSDRAIATVRPDALAFNSVHCRPAHVLPRELAHVLPPLPVTEWEPTTAMLFSQAKEKMLQLAAFQSTYHDSLTPMTPDMAPLIIDTEASV
jgi:hypothetical protein